MTHPTKSQYLESKVLTASQPQLQVMLLDGALRFGRQAKELWASDTSFAEVDRYLERMANVVDELTHGVAEGSTEMSKELEEQYAFVYRELAACRIDQTAEKLEACLQLLEYQRETWKLACEKLETQAATAKPVLPHMALKLQQPSQGFSLEA